MKKRLTFKCWKCDRNYSLLLEVESNAKLSVECPFCEEQGVVDLHPFRKQSTGVFRGGNAHKAPEKYIFELPDVISTSQPKK